jgi:DNA modification methylase
MNCIDQTIGDNFALYHGDCVEVLKGLPDESIDYSIFSPPFSSLYTYSNSPRDMGNCKTDAEFFEHFSYLVAELARVMKSGKEVSFHCMLLPASKQHDGYIGLKDFRGDLIRAFKDGGFIHHSEVVIWKDPVTAMQRTKAVGLLHKSIRENANHCRQGIPDYLITMKKPGDPVERVRHTDYPVDHWQKVASPVWMDINPSKTLQRESAREEDDERHICPLQLEVIERGIELWTNPGDVVLSPFAGIGSEGHVSIQMGRKFIGVELKESYYKQATKNLKQAHSISGDLFAA